MENQDKLYNQFKSAAENAETKDFPGMENVWNRVEQKLDTKVLKKETKLWKKLTVAASILLVASLGYHFWNNEKTITTPTNEIVTNDSITTPNALEENSNPIVSSEIQHPAIKENAEQILKEQTNADVIVMNDTVKPKKMAAPMPAAVSEVTVHKEEVENDVIKKQKETNSYDGYFNAKNYEARSVKNNGYKVMVNTNQQKTKSKKEEPLLVIDDVAEDLQKLGKLNADDVESIIVLPDPLYIINGVEYTEKEVFGPNPTSPYSPLNEQYIETISILQKEKATEVYGKKGEKGVVIITTKNGKPKLKK